MNNDEHLHLMIKNGSWHARTNDPRIFDLIGTDTLPLPFTAQDDSFEVLKFAWTRHPEARITMET